MKFCFKPRLAFLSAFACGLGLLVITGSIEANAQKRPKKSPKSPEEEVLELNEESLQSDSVPNIELELDEEAAQLAEEEEKQESRRKTKKKKKVYFNLKTQGGFTKTGTSSLTIEIFRHVSASYLMKNSYQQEIHYYDPKAKRIKSEDYNTLKAKIAKGQAVWLLHGQYQKYRDRELREEGYFYKGLKHGKWWEFDSKGTLMEKITYHLGHSAEAKISYYDEAETKMKEIVPFVHGRCEGKYYRFYENGVIAEMGDYENNCKVKLWREWHENRARKRDTQCPQNWWEGKEPFLLREWNEKGQMTYDLDRGGKIKN